MLNYVTNRFEEFSAEIKQTGNLSSIDEIIQPRRMSSKDVPTTVNKVNEDVPVQTIASPQSIDMKKSSSAFPTKVFRMRASVLTELLEVSHIRSIRQIFISILVLLFLQVSITDLFERGT